MKAIASFALRRPYTFVVLAILIVVFGIRSLLTTAIDVFPTIKIPVVAAVWSYTGLLPNDVSGRITYYYERALTSTVEGISHLESGSFYGRNIVKIFFQPGTDVAKAEAEVTAVSQTIVQQLPPGISPPLVMSLDASSVPVMMLQVTSDSMTPAELYNMAITRLRPQLVTIPGSVIPHPYGGAQNTVPQIVSGNHRQANRLSALLGHRQRLREKMLLNAAKKLVGLQFVFA